MVTASSLLHIPTQTYPELFHLPYQVEFLLYNSRFNVCRSCLCCVLLVAFCARCLAYEPLAPPLPPAATAVPVWQDRTIASSKLRMLEYSAFMEVPRDQDTVSNYMLYKDIRVLYYKKIK